MTWTAPDYDNDEAMAELGRTLIDMLIGQRNRYGRDSDAIAGSLYNEVAQYVEEDEPEDDERDDGDQGNDTPDGPEGP